MITRRAITLSGLVLPLSARADDTAIATALRAGGVVLALRHALAPGTFDPPSFKLGDCSTQRNLSDEGRAQARRTGAWFVQRELRPATVRSSPWCRCIDTATLAFGRAEPWAALGSPRASSESVNDAALQQLRQGVAAVPVGQFEVWVTHMFVLAALVQANAGSGEGLLLKNTPGGLRVLGRLPAA